MSDYQRRLVLRTMSIKARGLLLKRPLNITA